MADCAVVQEAKATDPLTATAKGFYPGEEVALIANNAAYSLGTALADDQSNVLFNISVTGDVTLGTLIFTAHGMNSNSDVVASINVVSNSSKASPNQGGATTAKAAEAAETSSDELPDTSDFLHLC